MHAAFGVGILKLQNIEQLLKSLLPSSETVCSHLLIDSKMPQTDQWRESALKLLS